MNPEFWRGKRVFITGHTGFKGSWLSLWLQSLGAEVTGFSLSPPTNPNMFQLADVERGMSSVEGDIRDFAHLHETLADVKPEIVIHMAAQSLVRHSYSFPMETYETNVMGTVCVLEALRKTPEVRAALIITSDKCYENNEFKTSFCESDPLLGSDPYSNSKSCAELVTAAYRSSYFKENENHNVLAIASARAGNVIGGGDWGSDRLVPDILKSFQRREPVKLRYPTAVRPWQHVLEPLSGYLTLLERLISDGAAYSEAWNFGPRLEEPLFSVETVTSKIASLLNTSSEYQESSYGNLSEAHHLSLNSEKAHNRLRWRSKWTLDQALEATVSWHRAQIGNKFMREFSINQITAYMNS